MKLKACRNTATTSSEFQSPLLDESAETENVPKEDPHFEGPKFEGATRSFVQIDQATLFQLLQVLDATQFKVFVFLTMRAYGWDDKARRVGDGIVRASGTFVAKGSNLSVATAERCIGKLKEKGLISKSTHSCKWGNTYHVKPILLRRGSDDKAPPENKKKPPQIEVSKNEDTQKEEPKTAQVPQNKAPSSIKNRPLGPSNLGTNIDSRYSDLSLTETFENYFSKIRAPIAEKKERSCLVQIQKRNPDVIEEEFLECFNIVSESKDSKGAPISMKFLWMANGFDTILPNARLKIQARKRREDERQRAQAKAEEEAALEKPAFPEEAEQAMNAIRSILGPSHFKSFNQDHKAPSEKAVQERRAFLLTQARQLAMAAGTHNTYSSKI